MAKKFLKSHKIDLLPKILCYDWNFHEKSWISQLKVMTMTMTMTKGDFQKSHAILYDFFPFVKVIVITMTLPGLVMNSQWL